MNKSYLQYAALMLLFTFMIPSFAMGGKVFKLARFVGVTTLPTLGLYHSKNYKKALEKVNVLDFDEELPTQPALNDWFEGQKKQANMPHSKPIFLVTHKNSRHAHARANEHIGVVSVSSEVCDQLHEALVNQPLAEERLHQALKEFEYAKQQKEKRGIFKSFLLSRADNQLIKSAESQIDVEKQNVAQCKAKIARESMIVNHEFGHIVHEDSNKYVYALTTIPLGVEALSFGATKLLRKLYNIQPQPKTFLKTMLRSGSAIGAIVPKALANAVLGGFLSKHWFEAPADTFACEHAVSRLELEEFAKYWKEHETDYYKKNKISDSRLERVLNSRIIKEIIYPLHPIPADRRQMVEGYINQWDRDHAHEAGRCE